MADVAGITAIRPTPNTQQRLVGYGATITFGNALYYDTTAKEYVLADADSSVTTAAATGVAITPGVDGGSGYIAEGGSIVLVGATLVVGQTYIVSDTPGGIKPISDAATGDWITQLGNASSATVLDLAIVRTGNQVP